MKKHIVCIGDSNTHGYCADPTDCADGGIRFNEDERWTCLLQKALGDEYLVTEEGLSGRTTVFPDPLHENMDVLPYLPALLKSHEDIDLLIIMLGTNDTKDRFSATSAVISIGLERLVRKAMSVDCWGNKTPNILIVAPAPILSEIKNSAYAETMGYHCAEKSQQLAKYYKEKAEQLGVHFMDANGCEVNTIDYTHLTKKGHRQLSDMFTSVVPKLV